jgi:methyl-accepting chemotaxis protein
LSFWEAAASLLSKCCAISKLLQRQRDTIASLAEGDIDINVPYTDRPDEIGDIARSAEVFRDNLIKQRSAWKKKLKRVVFSGANGTPIWKLPSNSLKMRSPRFSSS